MISGFSKPSRRRLRMFHRVFSAAEVRGAAGGRGALGNGARGAVAWP